MCFSFRKKKEMTQIPNAARNEPRASDWLFWDVVDYSSTEVKEWDSQMLARNLLVLDQSDNKDTKMACGSFSNIQSVNIDNILEEFDAWYWWASTWMDFVEFATPRHNERGRGSPIEVGSLHQDQMDYLMDRKLIKWYIETETVFEAKVSINRGRCISTGSDRIDRSRTRQAPYTAYISSGSGHFFLIVGFDDDMIIGNKKGFFICLNSYWDNSYDNGYFYLHYGDFWVLYTPYALVPKSDNSQVIVAWKLKLEKIAENSKPK